MTEHKFTASCALHWSLLESGGPLGAGPMVCGPVSSLRTGTSAGLVLGLVLRAVPFACGNEVWASRAGAPAHGESPPLVRTRGR